MKLTKQQESALIELGFETLIGKLMGITSWEKPKVKKIKPVQVKRKKSKFSLKQRRDIGKRMRKMWANKRKAASTTNK